MSANRFKLANTGLSLDAVIRAAVTIARKAAGSNWYLRYQTWVN